MRNHSRARAGAKPGFTLLEVILALAIGGVVLVTARALVEELADQARRLARQTAVDDQRTNGERMLRALAGAVEVATPESGPFDGNADRVQFTTWCNAPAGWMERCAVTLAFVNVSGAPALVADLPTRGRVVLAQGFARGVFRYLMTAGAGGRWSARWGPGPRAPLALGVVLDTDTLIVRMGDRG